MIFINKTDEDKFIISRWDIERIKELIPFAYEADIRELVQILDTLEIVK